jgi:hypothetical protein
MAVDAACESLLPELQRQFAMRVPVDGAVAGQDVQPGDQLLYLRDPLELGLDPATRFGHFLGQDVNCPDDLRDRDQT